MDRVYGYLSEHENLGPLFGEAGAGPRCVLKHHRGEMRLAPKGTGSTLTYVIEVDAKVPLTGPLLKRTIEGNVRSGIQDVDRRA